MVALFQLKSEPAVNKQAFLVRGLTSLAAIHECLEVLRRDYPSVMLLGSWMDSCFAEYTERDVREEPRLLG